MFEICRGVTPELMWVGKQIDVHSRRGSLEMPRNDKPVPSIVSPSAKDRNRLRLEARGGGYFEESLCGASSRVFHQLQAGYAQPLGGQTVDFAHLRGGQSFHSRFTTRLQHPAAADVHDLAGNILRLFGSKEVDRGSYVFDRGRAADGKPRVPNAARLTERQLVLIDARGIHDVDGNPVLRF